MPRSLLWQILLLLPQPLLTLLYLAAVRAERVPPRFAPVVALALLPLVSGLVGARTLRRPEAVRSRGVQFALLAVAALEISLTVLAAAVVGFAIGLRSL